MNSLLTNYEETAAVILFVIGMMNLLLAKNLLRKIIGLDIMDAAVYLFLASMGYIEGRSAPIISNGVTDAEAYSNPIPAGLVLTGIVVSVSVSALMMALSVDLYRQYNTLNIDEIMMKLREEEEGLTEISKILAGVQKDAPSRRPAARQAKDALQRPERSATGFVDFTQKEEGGKT